MALRGISDPWLPWSSGNCETALANQDLKDGKGGTLLNWESIKSFFGAYTDFILSISLKTVHIIILWFTVSHSEEQEGKIW